MDSLEALERSCEEFRGRLAAIGDDQWSLPTPCDEWDVRALANHVVAGCAAYTELLHGAAAQRMLEVMAEDVLGADPVAALDRHAGEMIAAFREPGALDRTVHHAAGDIPGSRLLGMRLLEFVVHGWDLSRATGGDEDGDADVAELVYEAFSTRTPSAASASYFKPATSCPSDAPAHHRLLALAGRRP